MADRHLLGGRPFLTVQESTVEQDFIFLALVKEAGIDDLTQSRGETTGDFAVRILETAIANGVVLRLLACLLVPEPEVERPRGLRRLIPGRRDVPPWTRETAEETAEFLGSLRSPEDKAKIRALVLSLLVHFFESGTVSLWTTPTSSVEPVPRATTNGEASRPTDATGAGPPSS